MERIILIGAHGTGKSTLANALAVETGAPVVESVARQFGEMWRVLEDTGAVKPGQDVVKQECLSSWAYWDFMRWSQMAQPVIMTRSPLDTLAYMKCDRNIPESLYNLYVKTWGEDVRFTTALWHSLFIYLPIEFGIEDDGVRPTDVLFQRDVDDAMRELADTFRLTPVEVHGTVEERVQQVLRILP